jgi:hypothetical protein
MIRIAVSVSAAASVAAIQMDRCRSIMGSRKNAAADSESSTSTSSIEYHHMDSENFRKEEFWNNAEKFANFCQICYTNDGNHSLVENVKINKVIQPYGCDPTKSKFFENGNMQTWSFETETEVFIAVRGTEMSPSNFSEMKADAAINTKYNKSSPISADAFERAWMRDVDQEMVARYATQDVLVHNGYLQSAQELYPMIREHLRTHTGKTVYMTGHSMGAGVAQIMNFWMHLDNDVTEKPKAIWTYGSPPVGNPAFVNFLNDLEIDHYRWVNGYDAVPRATILQKYTSASDFHHQGELLFLTKHGIQVEIDGEMSTDKFEKGYTVAKFGTARCNKNIAKGKPAKDHLLGAYLKNIETSRHLIPGKTKSRRGGFVLARQLSDECQKFVRKLSDGMSSQEKSQFGQVSEDFMAMTRQWSQEEDQQSPVANLDSSADTFNTEQTLRE